MRRGQQTPVALTVAGSDSGGGAGIQTDLKIFWSLGVFGTSALTCVTAQNPDRISAVQPLDPDLVVEQIDRVFEAFPVGGAKTGMLYNAGIIEAVTVAFARRRFRNLVVDPVLVASSGSQLLKKAAIGVLRRKLFPLAAVVTPNLAEAEVFWRRNIQSLGEMREAARALADQFGAPVLVKGGHLPGATRAVDVLWDGRQFCEVAAPIVRGIKTHGTGCAFSAAVAARLALGDALPEAVVHGKQLITRAIRHAIHAGRYPILRI